jgi:hypothetical protein
MSLHDAAMNSIKPHSIALIGLAIIPSNITLNYSFLKKAVIGRGGLPRDIPMHLSVYEAI